MSQYNIEITDLHAVRGGGYQCKVMVPDLGMYMWGWRVRLSKKSPAGWWVQEPSTEVPKGSKNFKRNPEFDHSYGFWEEIEAAIIAAVEAQTHTERKGKNHDEIVEVTDDDIAKIESGSFLDDIPPEFLI